MKKWNIGNLWKKYKYVGLVVLAGILLMLLPGKKTDAQTQESGGSFSLEDTERRMEELLGRMDGVGRVQVMLTLKNSSALELAEDADDTDRDGELRRQREPVTLNRGSGYQDVVVTRETYPVYLGAVVVCQGAGSGGVRLAVTEAAFPPTASRWCNGIHDRRDGHEEKMEEAGGGGGRAAAGVRGGVHELALH